MRALPSSRSLFTMEAESGPGAGGGVGGGSAVSSTSQRFASPSVFAAIPGVAATSVASRRRSSASSAVRRCVCTVSLHQNSDGTGHRQAAATSEPRAYLQLCCLSGRWRCGAGAHGFVARRQHRFPVRALQTGLAGSREAHRKSAAAWKTEREAVNSGPAQRGEGRLRVGARQLAANCSSVISLQHRPVESGRAGQHALIAHHRELTAAAGTSCRRRIA